MKKVLFRIASVLAYIFGAIGALVTLIMLFQSFNLFLTFLVPTLALMYVGMMFWKYSNGHTGVVATKSDGNDLSNKK